MNKPFLDLLDKMKVIHASKAMDYSSDSTTDPLENFYRSNEIAEWFPDEYKSFAVLIGTKLARLGTLLTKGRTPNNESIEDSFLDLATYCVLMYSFYAKNNKPQNTDPGTVYNLGIKATDRLGAQYNYESCTHKYVNTNRICKNCGDSIDVSQNYGYDLIKDLYIKIP